MRGTQPFMRSDDSHIRGGRGKIRLRRNSWFLCWQTDTSGNLKSIFYPLLSIWKARLHIPFTHWCQNCSCRQKEGKQWKEKRQQKGMEI